MGENAICRPLEFVSMMKNVIGTTLALIIALKKRFIVCLSIDNATERRKALNSSGWEFIDKYREHHDYYKITCKR